MEIFKYIEKFEDPPEEVKLGERVDAFLDKLFSLLEKLRPLDLTGMSKEEKEKFWGNWDTIDRTVITLSSTFLVAILELESAGVISKVLAEIRSGNGIHSKDIRTAMIPFSMALIGLCSKKIQKKLEYKYQNPATTQFYPYKGTD